MTATVAVGRVADGVLIERRVRLLDGSGPVKSVANWRPTANVLVRGKCLYFENGDEVSEPPDVCLPLREGSVWGDAKQVRGHWHVARYEKKLGWRLEAHLASGDDNFVWFKTNMGVTAERTVHNGTYYERRVKLVRFEAGK